MRRILSMILVLSLGIFFQAGCGGVGVRMQPSGVRGYQNYPYSYWPNSGMRMDSASLNFTPYIVGAVIVAAAAVAYIHFTVKHDKIQNALTPAGARVQILTHAEAPEDAVFLGDLHTEEHFRLDLVKNDLRNQTARMGGNLMVLDNIQQEVYSGRTWGYRGIGRAYKTKGK